MCKAETQSRGSNLSRHRGALGLLCAASYMAVLDTTIVSIALPSLQRDLGLAGNAQWVLNAYALTFGGFLLLGGRLADVFGRRRLLMAGLATFAAASLLAGLAATSWMLIGARLAQGLAQPRWRRRPWRFSRRRSTGDQNATARWASTARWRAWDSSPAW